MKRNLVLAAFVAFSFKGMSQTTWVADKAHSKLGFTVVHLLVTDVDGNFKNFDAKMVSAKPDFSDASISLTAVSSSVSTDNDQRDNHLKSPDFFDVAKFPSLSFVSTSFTKVDAKNYKLAGNLTIHGITKPVVLNVVLGGVGASPYTKKPLAGFKVTGSIKRADFALGSSIPSAVVSDEVTLTANVEMDQQ